MALRSFCLHLSLSRLSVKFLPATENARGSFPSFSIFGTICTRHELAARWLCTWALDSCLSSPHATTSGWERCDGACEPTACEMVGPSSAVGDAGMEVPLLILYSYPKLRPSTLHHQQQKWCFVFHNYSFTWFLSMSESDPGGEGLFKGDLLGGPG